MIVGVAAPGIVGVEAPESILRDHDCRICGSKYCRSWVFESILKDRGYRSWNSELVLWDQGASII